MTIPVPAVSSMDRSSAVSPMAVVYAGSSGAAHASVTAAAFEMPAVFASTKISGEVETWHLGKRSLSESRTGMVVSGLQMKRILPTTLSYTRAVAPFPWEDVFTMRFLAGNPRVLGALHILMFGGIDAGSSIAEMLFDVVLDCKSKFAAESVF